MVNRMLNHLQHDQHSFSYMLGGMTRATERGAGWQITPGPQGPRGLITPNGTRSGSLIMYTSSSFQSYFLGCENCLLASLTGGLVFSFFPGPLNSLGGLGYDALCKSTPAEGPPSVIEIK